MKKIISLLLTIILIFAMAAPASAAIRNIITENNDTVEASLHTKCKAVTKFDSSLEDIVTDLTDTLKTMGDNASSISAPLVGKNLRICVVKTGNDYITLINPEIIEQSGSEVFGESCLSLPGIYTRNIERPTNIRVRFSDINNNPVEMVFEGFNARNVMHQIDHLNGIMLTDRNADNSASILSVGNLPIIICLAGIAVGIAIRLFILKKKKSAIANDSAEKETED